MGWHLQPSCIVISTEDCQVDSVFVLCQDIMWKFDSTLDAVDCLFKLFFSLNLEYPVEAVQVFSFLQRFIYEIETVHDKRLSTKALILSKQLVENE